MVTMVLFHPWNNLVVGHRGRVGFGFLGHFSACFHSLLPESAVALRWHSEPWTAIQPGPGGGTLSAVSSLGNVIGGAVVAL